MANANVKWIYEVSEELKNGEKLCLQWCKYNYDDCSKSEFGYRFIWRLPNGNLRPQRGQAIIYSSKMMFRLIEKAKKAGWFISCEKEGK